MRKFFSKFNIIYLVIFVVIATYSAQVITERHMLSPQRVIEWDVVCYYDYLPATFILHDIKHMEPTAESGGQYWGHVLPNGNKVIKTSMGMSMMYLPFFAVANAVAESLGYQKNGFTEPYSWALIISSIFYLFWGFFFLAKMLKKLNFSTLIISLIILIIGLSTNLYWYATFSAPYSHAYSFSLISLFLYLTILWHENPSVKNSIFIGLVSGLISLIRPTNILIALVFVLYNVKSFKEFKDKFAFFLKEYKNILIIIGCALIVWVPQFIYWKVVTGSWLFYSYGDDERFFFNDPKIFKVLFGWRKGWLIYTPVMLFSVIGMFMLPRHRKDFAVAIIAFFVINLYVISSWWCWWYGGSFGMRPMIDIYGLMAIPFAVFLKWIFENKRLVVKIPLLILLAWLVFRSVFNSCRYGSGAIHWGDMTKEAYFDSYWGKRSANFYDLLEAPDYEAAKKGIR